MTEYHYGLAFISLLIHTLVLFYLLHTYAHTIRPTTHYHDPLRLKPYNLPFLTSFSESVDNGVLYLASRIPRSYDYCFPFLPPATV